MAERGNPGLTTFKWPRGTPDSFAAEFLPARRVAGWSLKHVSGTVLTPDGRFFARTAFPTPIILAETDVASVFRHAEGSRSGGLTLAEVKQALAATLVEYGAA
jgi:hypothetical protein